MNKVIYRLTLDLTSPGVQHTIYAKRGDVHTRQIVIKLRMNGTAYKISDGATAYLYALADGTEIFDSCEIMDNTIIATLSSSILSANNAVIELRLTDASGAVLTTPQIRVLTEGELYSEDVITASDRFSALLSAINAAENSRITDISANGNIITITYADGTSVSAEINISVHEGENGTGFTIGNALELTANSVLNVKTTDEVSDKSPLPLTSKGAAALEEKIRQDFPSAINDALIQAMENGEFKGENGRSAYEYALDGGFVGSEVDFAKSLAGNGDVLPDYWEEHLKEKISAINALHDTGGKECFSFIVISDIHYEQNLGKKAPLIAKKISDECGIKYVLILGDCGTRNGILYGLDYIDNEWKEIEKMLSPIRDRLLITDGNHDGSYGATDGDGDGVIDGVHGSGNSAFNFTPQKKYNKIKRKVSLIDGVTFDENGCGYYVDDKNSKIRYIVLSTHNNKYVENGDGSSKYSNMNNFRFGQSQFDLVIKALSSLEDGWSVLVASHVPLDRSGELLHWGGTAMNGDNYLTEGEVECWIMADVLNAFVNKTTYNGSFIGTQGDTQAYKNLADRTSSDWLSGYRTSNSGVTQEEGFETTNFLGDGETCVGNMTIYYKNATMSNQRLLFYNADKELVYNTYPTTFTVHTGFDGSATEGQLFIDIDRNEALGSAVYVRLCLNSGDTEPIITLNEPIVSSDNTYDAVSVDVDFTNANGTLIGYFGGHVHNDSAWGTTYDWDGRLKRCDFWTITTRCDSKNENDSALIAERVAGTVTEQSFDVFTVNTAKGKIYATKIGAGSDRVIEY